MKITKQLNNNIVIASDTQGREVVLMGKGIGFRRKPGMEPDMSLVEKQFFGLSSGQHIQKLAELLDRIPVVVSNTDDFTSVSALASGKVDLNSSIIEIKK